MVRYIPLVLMCLVGGALAWAAVRWLRPSKPTWPEASFDQLLAHFNVEAFQEIPGFCYDPLPVQLEFPTLRTVMHIDLDMRMRVKTTGYDWRPLDHPILHAAVQRHLLSN